MSAIDGNTDSRSLHRAAVPASSSGAFIPIEVRETRMSNDVIVIGAGLAGYHASLEASRLGFDVLLVDPGSPPGAESGAPNTIAAALLRAAGCGARLNRSEIAELATRQRTLVELELYGAQRRLAEAGVRIVRGRASLMPSGHVSIDGRGALGADHIVLATGSRPRWPARFVFDNRVVCDSDSILHFDNGLPRSLVIVGAEIEGCEFACMFAALGTAVTLVERRRRLLRCADPEVLDVLHREMQALGVSVALEEEIRRIDVTRAPGEPHATVRLGSGRTEICSRLLILAGREGVHSRDELTAAGVEVDARGFVVVNEFFETTRPGVSAIGDAIGSPLTASVVPHQACVAISHAAQREPPNREYVIAAHTRPELAVVGMIEEALKRLDLPYGVGRAELPGLQQAEVVGAAQGLLKLTYAREDRRLLGVQIIGARATELIQIGALVIEAGGAIDRLIDQSDSHPDLSQAYRRAALDALSEADRATTTVTSCPGAGGTILPQPTPTVGCEASTRSVRR
jgi:NAD(P) transhydrogenase